MIKQTKINKLNNIEIKTPIIKITYVIYYNAYGDKFLHHEQYY